MAVAEHTLGMLLALTRKIATANADVRAQCEALGSDGVFDKSIETDALIEYCQSLPAPGPD